MDMKRLLQALRRRWPVAVCLLLVTLLAAAYYAKRPGPYQTASQVVLLPSTQVSLPNGGNPYLSFQPALDVTADLLIREVMDPRTAQSLASQGFTGSYTAVADPLTSGPVIDISVIASSKSIAESTLQAVTDEVAAKLNELQVGMKPRDKITSLTISFDPTAALYLSKKIRPLVEVIGLGLVLSMAITLAVDTALAGRRVRPRARAPRTSASAPDLNAASDPARWRLGRAVRPVSPQERPASHVATAPAPRDR